jgi:hypothetical protein
MAQVDKIDSNSTGLRYREETSPGEVDSGVWTGLEPNSYNGFGAQNTLLAREPISETRQRKKGVITDREANGGFNMDMTQSNLVDLLQGFFCADLRDKDETTISDAAAATDDFTVPNPDGSNFVSGDLIFVSGMDDDANNGLHQVNGSTATTISTTSSLVDASTQTGTVRRVGYVFSAGDLEMDASGTLPQLITTTKDFTDLGLVPGEWLFIGGDSASDRFFTSANNGFARVRAVSANAITLDKMAGTAVTDDGTDTGAGGAGLAIKLFFAARILKDESDSSLIVERSYQLERSLGAPDDASPAQIQSEYLVGAYGGECTFNIATADKLTVDLSFTGLNFEVYTGAEGRKAGTRPAIEETDCFNTSSDVSRAKLALVSSSVENPTALFAALQDLSITINNNLTANKAVATVGAFAVSKGLFAVSGSMTAFFNNVTAVESVNENSDATLDLHFVRENAGVTFDLPLIALGDGSANVESNNPVMIPLTFEAAVGSQVHEDLDHTLLMGFWDYLPTAAAS